MLNFQQINIHIIMSIAVVWMFATTIAMADTSDTISAVGYTIQAGAFKELANAEHFTESLREKKLDAAYFRKENGLFAVTFGNFPTYDDAVQNAKQLKEERVIDRYYVAVPKKRPKRFENVTSLTDSTSSASKVRPHDEEMGKIAARTAERFAGIPYKWGGNNVVEGLDCSAFVKAVYYLVGINIPRTAHEQFNAGLAIEKDELQDGDLLFFGKGPQQITHVGMYIGNGKFIHAPRRGEPIQITPVDEEKYVKKYVGSRRLL
jgi:gamma-D-glutamyl-L-lysine dipeptidyl-peptidase